MRLSIPMVCSISHITLTCFTRVVLFITSQFTQSVPIALRRDLPYLHRVMWRIYKVQQCFVTQHIRPNNQVDCSLNRAVILNANIERNKANPNTKTNHLSKIMGRDSEYTFQTDVVYCIIWFKVNNKYAYYVPKLVIWVKKTHLSARPLSKHI